MSIMWHLLCYSTLIVYALACGSDFSGPTARGAKFDIRFFAPLGFTYPVDQDMIYPGQSTNQKMAERCIDRDLNLAISDALLYNKITLANIPNITYDYEPVEAQIEMTKECQTDSFFVQHHGTLVFKCVASKDEQGESRHKREVGADTSESTQSPDGSTGSPGASTESPGASTESPGASTESPGASTESPGASTESPGASTESPGASTESPGASTESPGASTNNPDGSTETPKGPLHPQPFEQSMTLHVVTSQVLFESQWKELTRNVQRSLEKSHMQIIDEITVTLDK